jgi:putative transcriptional regulator
MDSLRGKLLIASPALIDPNFHRTVILIAEHTGEGAMGLVLNRPAETLVVDVVPDLSDLAEDGAPVYFGGPVASDSVIVLAEFDDIELAGVLLDDDLGFVGSEAGEMSDVAEGVRRARVYAGHAGWGPGQLEGELEDESWIIEPPQREEIFSEDADGLWAAVLRRKGREYALLATMPPDPSVN